MTETVPTTVSGALDPGFLRPLLARLTDDAPIAAIETVETIRTMATKVRFKAFWDGGPAKGLALCVKGLLDSDPEARRAGAITVLEADFYRELAPRLDLRLPECVATVIDREAPLALVYMRDLIAGGANFCSALEPFTADDIASSLDQLARLHARGDLIDRLPGIKRRVADPARLAYTPADMLQQQLDDGRGQPLQPHMRDAPRLIAAMQALARADAALPQTLVHGDSHAGNIFRTAQGLGLIDWQVVQRGGWALDVAYHVAAALPVAVAEREERALLHAYLENRRSLGGEPIDREEAWRQYRTASVYGYYLWAITRRVDPRITHTFVERLGKAAERHDSFGLLRV